MEEGLTLQQERFCKYYTQPSELFGSGVLSYAKAYDYDLENASRLNEVDANNKEIKGTSEYDKMHLTCRANASRLLTNDNIIKRVRQLLNELMTDDVIDARLIEIIVKGNDADSLRALQEYNKLKQRIVTKVDHTSKGNEIKGNTIVFADFTGDDSTTEN